MKNKYYPHLQVLLLLTELHLKIGCLRTYVQSGIRSRLQYAERRYSVS